MNDVTVCVCTYNEEKVIERCLAYIKKNGVSDDNIMVVDASTDRTSEIARRLGVKVISCEKGLEKQRQKAIDLCETSFLVFVDADDCIRYDSIKKMVDYCEKNKMAAVGVRVRVYRPKTYWEKAIDATWNYTMYKVGSTNMVGRPCLYCTSAIKDVGADTTFKGIGAEDTAISIRLEMKGYIQGISSAVTYRECPKTFIENLKAWIRYGKGDADVVIRYPIKKKALFLHNLVEYPIIRTWKLIKNKNGRYCVYTIGIGMTRFIVMLIICGKNALKNKGEFIK